jgi:hypothetical protein
LPDGEASKRTQLQRRVTAIVMLATLIFIMFAVIQGALQASYRLQQTVSVYYGLYSTAFALMIMQANVLLYSLRGAASSHTASGTGNSEPRRPGGKGPSSMDEDPGAEVSSHFSGSTNTSAIVRSVDEDVSLGFSRLEPAEKADVDTV